MELGNVETFENNDPKVEIFMKGIHRQQCFIIATDLLIFIFAFIGEISESSALIPKLQSENADKIKDQQVEMLMEGKYIYGQSK